MEKSVTQQGIFPSWHTDKEVDVSKLSGETHINVGICFCT